METWTIFFNKYELGHSNVQDVDNMQSLKETWMDSSLHDMNNQTELSQ